MENEINELKREIVELKQRVMFLEKKEKNRKIKQYVYIGLGILVLIISIFSVVKFYGTLNEMLNMI